MEILDHEELELLDDIVQILDREDYPYNADSLRDIIQKLRGK